MSLLSHTEEYRLADGSYASGRSAAVLVSPRDLVDAALARSSIISARFSCAIGFRETSGALNERDTDVTDKGTVVTHGLYMVTRGEQAAALMPDVDIYSLDGNTRIFVATMERKRALIVAAWRAALLFGRGIPYDPDSPDLLKYLAVAHNAGTGSVLPGIAKYGLDWDGVTDASQGGYAARNPTLEAVAKGYADEAASGGRYWDPSWEALSPAPGASSGFGVRAFLVVAAVAAAVVAFVFLRKGA